MKERDHYVRTRTKGLWRRRRAYNRYLTKMNWRNFIIVAREIGTKRKIVIGYPERNTRWCLFLPRTSSVYDRSGSGGPRPQKDRSKADDQRETQTRLSLSDSLLLQIVYEPTIKRQDRSFRSFLPYLPSRGYEKARLCLVIPCDDRQLSRVTSLSDLVSHENRWSAIAFATIARTVIAVA